MAYLVERAAVTTRGKPDKESIHSGHFMVSHFEAEDQDDEDDLAVPITESIDIKATVPVQTYVPESNKNNCQIASKQIDIETSLSKLFQCMSLAYRQKLTSPKWNRFRGIRLRWKDKIRLNNVIWRCWHLQFIRKENTLVCQFASPLDVDTHNKPEAIVLEGKYWKRKLAAVTAEYKKWRMFYRNNFLGHTSRENAEMLERDVEAALLFESNNGNLSNMNLMMVDEDYMSLMSDTLFSTIITNQPFMFPDSREMAKAGLADLIQPSLEPLQPNLDDYMDTMDPFQEFINNKLPTVPEEHSQAIGWDYTENIAQNDDLTAHVNTEAVSTNDVNSPIDSAFHHQSELSRSQRAGPIEKTVPLTTAACRCSNSDPSVHQQNIASSNYNNDQENFSVISKVANNMKPIMNVERGKIAAHSPPSSFYYDNNKSLNSNKSSTIFQGLILNDNKIQVKTEVSSLPNQQSQPGGSDTLRQTRKPILLPQQSPPSSTAAFKFLPITRANAKFTPQNPSPPLTQQNQPQFLLQNIPQSSSSSFRSSFLSLDTERVELGRRSGGVRSRGRGRSRSNTREPVKRPPPLISAISDPALITPQTNALLTHLLLSTAPRNDSLQTFPPNQLFTSTERPQHATTIKEELNVVPLLAQQQQQSSCSSTILSIKPSNIIVPIKSTDNLLLNTCSSSNSPTLESAQCVLSPVSSSQGSMRESPVRDKRVGHIHAEQKRRYNIKNGFDMIHSLIPHLNQNPATKLSKAAMLQKGADYIRQLRSERNQIREEMDSLKQHIETLNTSISNCQSMLPASRVSMGSRKKDNKIQEMFNEYVSSRTMENWKFWIFSLICRPLLNSFNNFVSTSSLDNLYSSTILWIEHHCTLVDLRPVVLNSLRYLCTKTEILSEPEKLPDEVSQLVLNNV